MKKLSITLCTILLLTLIGCGSAESGKNKPVFSSPSDITITDIINSTTVSELLKTYSIFSVTNTYSNTGDEVLEGAVAKQTFSINESGIIEANDLITYADGYMANAYYSSDSSDLNYYYIQDGYSDSVSLDAEEAESMFNASLLGYTEENASIQEAVEENDKYKITVSSEIGTTDTIIADPLTGLILSIESSYGSAKSDETSFCKITFDYSESQTLDRSAYDTYKAQNSNTDSSNSEQGNTDYFSATDIYGNTLTLDAISEAKLIMLNYWEPWCGPCVNEMPDLQKLYEKYKDDGLIIVGVYSSFDMDEEALDIVTGNNITYPILRSNSMLSTLAQDYYPATYFIDENFNFLSSEPYIGSRDYEEWEAIIYSYLY